MESQAANIVAEQASVASRLSAYFELTKPRIAIMLVLSSAAGFYLGSRWAFDFILFANSMIAILLLAFGVATLNQYLERDIDAKMPRTSGRPLPSSRLMPSQALIFGIILTAASLIYLLLAVNTLTAVLGVLVVIGYVFLYTPLKTKTSACTAIGAIPGAMPPLMGWTSATNEISIGAWILFAYLFLWQFPHFLSIARLYREDYKLAGIKMLPVLEENGSITARQIVIYGLLTSLVSVAPFFFGYANLVFLILATLLAVWFSIECIKAAYDRTSKGSRRLLLVTVIHLPLYFTVLVLNKI
ncbi:MAG TPA: heme o synthase [Pyrinomonadaceae bacterium]|nr:heme o synthase [Pyrinomonadaceae bacterium]